MTELLLELDRGAREPLRRQLERRLRECLEEGVLPVGARLPGARRLAADLGVSRGVVVDAYDALVAQGLLAVEDRKAPRVATGTHGPRPDAVIQSRRDVRYDLNPTAPDLSLFPRRAWLRATQHVLATLPDLELDYPVDGRGSPALRAVVADYLRRVRGVAAQAGDIVITQGFLQTVDLLCRLLRARGMAAIAVEDPSIVHQRETARRNGLDLVPVPVDREGMRVDALAASVARAVITTPAHQFPTGAVLSPARRRALVAWAEAVDGLIIEDDYDAEFRYDRRPIGAVQRLSPEHVAYVGTASKTLAPAVRLGWVAAPARWAEALADLKLQADGGSDVLGEHVLARMIGTGDYERHIRRLRHRYRRRRDALTEALAAQLPDVSVTGASAGLHVVIELPEGSDDEAVADRARQGGIGVRSLSHYRVGREPGPPGLVLGYGRLSAASIPHAVAEVRRALEGVSRWAPVAYDGHTMPPLDPPDVELRRATADDAQAIGAVFDAAVRAGWTYLGELAQKPMFEPEDWDQLVADHAPPNVLLVATDRTEKILGYVAAHPEDGELFLLFVHPSHGGRGIGRLLLDAAHDALRAAGRAEAYLFVHEQNERALSVYASAGYRPDGSVRESDFRGTWIRELRLVKPL